MNPSYYPRINPGFLVGHHEFHEHEERRAEREAVRIGRRLTLIAKAVRKKRKRRRGR